MELKLKELRKLAGYKSAKDVADKLGIPRSTYASYECGTRGIPLDVAIDVCDLLGCTLDELVGRKPVSAVRYATINLDDEDAQTVTEFAEFLRKRANED